MSYNYSDIRNYEFEKTIGEGNFAKVKLSIFKPTKEEFAIKIINKKKLKEKMKNTIFRENEIISKLKHPNIIKVIKILEDSKNFYIIMENCKKGELFDYIVAHQYLRENEASIFFYQLINGVEYLHSQNIAHRDLKPENLLLTENKTLKIIDFGLSHPFYGTKLLKTKCGSPSYAAPEIIIGDEYDGFKTDIWCCGVILYAMLCGFLPFEGENDPELFKNIVKCDPEIPEELSKDSKKLIRKIFTPNPKNRISIKEIKQTDFYLKGKKLYNKKYEILDKDNSPNDNQYNCIRNFCNDLLNEPNENNERSTNENVNNDINCDNEIHTKIDDENNNSVEDVTIGSDDENDNEIKNFNDHNINIFDINKIRKIKAAQAINANKNISPNKDIQNNINNKNNEKENDNKEIENQLQTNDNIEISKIPKMKLHFNFNNNLKNNYNDNHIINSFRKKLTKEELNLKLKQQFENHQKILKTEGNEFKKDAIKMQTINQKTESINTNNFNNNKNYISLNNEHKNKNNLNQFSFMPNIKDQIISNENQQKYLFIKIKDTKNTINMLNKNHKGRKLILGKSSNQQQYLLTDNNNQINKSTSFKRFCNNLIEMKSKPNDSNNKNIAINESSHSRNNFDEKKSNKTLNDNIVYYNNINSIDVKSINSYSINHKDSHSVNEKKNNFFSPWRNITKKIIRKGKISPLIEPLKNNNIKNNLKKTDLVNATPIRTPNLYYNSINININTINVNENKNSKFNDHNSNSINSERIKGLNLNTNEENKNYINSTDSNSINFIIDKRNNNNKINFSKIIEDSKKKHSLYFYNKNQNEDNGAKSVGPQHKKKNGLFYVLKTGNIQRNFGKNNLYKQFIVRKGNPKSEEKYKKIENIKNMPLLNIDNYYNYNYNYNFNSIKFK